MTLEDSFRITRNHVIGRYRIEELSVFNLGGVEHSVWAPVEPRATYELLEVAERAMAGIIALAIQKEEMENGVWEPVRKGTN